MEAIKMLIMGLIMLVIIAMINIAFKEPCPVVLSAGEEFIDLFEETGAAYEQ